MFRLRSFLVLLLALVFATVDARQVSARDNRGAARGAGGSSRGRAAAGAIAKSAAAHASRTGRAGAPFEPPRDRRPDVSDHEAADLCGSVAAGACSCM